MDKTDKKYGRLKVLKKSKIKYRSPGGQRQTQWYCVCECGKKCVVRGSQLTSGRTKSCGCLQKTNAVTHGKSYSSVYKVWRNIKLRCYNPNWPYFFDYGGRGIKMCSRWKSSFENFYKDVGDIPKGKCIDRKDNNGDYTPKNIRLVTQAENLRNTSRCKFWIVDGRRFNSLKEAAKLYGLTTEGIRGRCEGYESRGKKYPPRENCWSEFKYPRKLRKNRKKVKNQSKKLLAEKHS